MISFMVLGGPRSGTTWAANWLTTDSTLCLHDPLMEMNIAHLSQFYMPNKKVGASCTGLMFYPDWVNAVKCPKLILYRSVTEINNSLRRLGLVEVDEQRHLERMTKIKDAKIVPFEQLFNPKSAQGIAEYLGVPYDNARHELLRQMNIQPHWRHLSVGLEAMKQLADRIKETI